MKFLVLVFVGLTLAPGAAAQTTPAVDLVWTADTYKPPLYRGHTLATPQSQIKVTAIVSWPNQDENKLTYRWQQNGQNLTRASGLRKNTLSFSAGRAGEVNRVTVMVSSPGGATETSAPLQIRTVDPSLSFYQDEPGLGVNYGLAIGANLTLLQPEIRLVAEPYFFPGADVEGGKIDYRWRLNDQNIVPDSADNRLITFAAPAGASGESIIALAAESLNNVFQEAAREFKIIFGAANFNF